MRDAPRDEHGVARSEVVVGARHADAHPPLEHVIHVLGAGVEVIRARRGAGADDIDVKVDQRGADPLVDEAMDEAATVSQLPAPTLAGADDDALLLAHRATLTDLIWV
jgi:hypothetical protein